MSGKLVARGRKFNSDYIVYETVSKLSFYSNAITFPISTSGSAIIIFNVFE